MRLLLPWGMVHSAGRPPRQRGEVTSACERLSHGCVLGCFSPTEIGGIYPAYWIKISRVSLIHQDSIKLLDSQHGYFICPGAFVFLFNYKLNAISDNYICIP